MSTAQQLLAYWQQIFFETVYFDRICCDTSQFTHLLVERNLLKTGRLDTQSLQSWSDYFQASKTREVLVAPFCLSYFDEADESGGIQENQFLIPLLCAATLHADGTLTLREKISPPWVLPTLMNPMAAHGMYVGSRETYQRLLDAQAGQSHADWLSFFRHGCQLLESLSKNAWLTCLEAHHYALHADSLIIATDILPKDHLLFFPDLSDTDSVVFQRYCQFEEIEFEPLIHDKLPHLDKHCGQMGAESLAPDARQALAHLLALPSGHLQSVATPLGSQYHAMVGHLVASQLVDAALKCEELPLMVVASESADTWCRAWQTSKEVEHCRPLTMRWLPEAPTHFGISIVKGQLQQWQYKLNASYIPQAKQFFINQFSSEFDQEFRDFKKISEYLHQQLKTKYTSYLSGLEIAQAWLAMHAKLDLKYAAQAGLDNTLQQLQRKDQDLESDYQQCYRAQKIWRDILDSRSLAKTVFDQLPVFKNKKQEIIREFLKKYCKDLIDMDEQPIEDFESVTRFLTERLRQIRVERTKQHTVLTQICDDMASRGHWQRRWAEWQQQFFYQGNTPKLPWILDDKNSTEIQEEVYWYLDQALRTELYWLATHYWEAMWLSEVDIHFNAYDQEYLPVKTTADWRHYAMLGHAFILSLSEIPKVFESAFLEKTMVMDWLIVEDAQRFLPMEALSVLRQTNRLVALGDEQAVQPPRAMTAIQDIQAVEKQDLAHTDDELDELGYRGFLASSGSFYRLVQDKSFFKTESPYGLLPTNTLKLYYDSMHAPALLDYANTAVYKDSMKQVSLRQILDQELPVFGYLTCQYQSQLSTGVFTNQDEAMAIADWLASYMPILEKTGSVAILTPFAAQKICIEAQLDQQKLNRVPVHTFESLGHNFYHRIIFSPTYTSLDPKPLCFDQGAHWLHVAIQHALESFWVFGDPTIFDPKTHSPSGYLAKLLFARLENQLSRRISGRKEIESTLITRDSLEEYQQALIQCVNTATQQVIVISPRLDPDHISVLQFEETIQALRARQIQVVIYIGNQAIFGWKDPAVQTVLNRWVTLGVSVKIVHNCHTNQLLLDNHVLIEGSIDWLNSTKTSAGAVFGDSWCYRRYDRTAGSALVKQTLFDLDRRVVRRLEPAALVDA